MSQGRLDYILETEQALALEKEKVQILKEHIQATANLLKIIFMTIPSYEIPGLFLIPLIFFLCYFLISFSEFLCLIVFF